MLRRIPGVKRAFDPDNAPEEICQPTDVGKYPLSVPCNLEPLSMSMDRNRTGEWRKGKGLGLS